MDLAYSHDFSPNSLDCPSYVRRKTEEQGAELGSRT